MSDGHRLTESEIVALAERRRLERRRHKRAVFQLISIGGLVVLAWAIVTLLLSFGGPGR